jgi:quinone-modifying oxidoreductase subunit QmoB
MERISVFLCSGCGIGDAGGLDRGGLEDEARAVPGVATCLWHEHLCSADGIALIKRTIAAEELDAVAIVACSGRAKRAEFDLAPPTVVERIDLRELCLWITAPTGGGGDEPTDLQRLALDSLRIGLTRLRKTKAGEPFRLETVSRSVLVLGGGVAGVSAALGVARAGYQAVLVEREARLGGLVGQLHRQFPQQPPYSDLVESTAPGLIGEVEGTPGVTVRTSTEVSRIGGGPGLFEVILSHAGGNFLERVGAIVLATGARPYDPARLERLGYGRSARVVTSLEVERMAAAHELAGIGRVAFVQCAGSRDPEHLSYCSSHCCSTTLKQALYVREQNPESKVFIIYKDIRTPGRAEDFYRRVQEEEGVFLARGEVARVEPTAGSVLVEVAGSALGDRVEIEVDLVVLATGLVPSTHTGDPAFDDRAVSSPSGAAASGDAAARPPARALRLDYRQGPELPNLKHGFPDSHFICFPYETRRTGIYAAGTVRAPMDSQRAADDGAGAALKAIQCIEATARGAALHPRSGDTSWPDFNMPRCTQCKRCTEECPFGALNEDDRSNPLPHPTRCRRCGTCMGACPERIISFRDFSIDMIGSMIKSIEVPDELEEKPRVLVLACENDAYPALEIAGARRHAISPWVRIVPLRCLGSLHLVWITDALAHGIDGILLLGCRYGEDSQCHFHDGSRLCADRLSKVSETLDRLALGPERVRMEQVQMSDVDRLPGLIDDFVRSLAGLEPNPYKGM